ncbi:hypothetical protein [Prosthecobacter sp.]|uniref:hypothetical protein n=1 Tax=Prosthecobacter sp. TaxID=1965333 RepID=UPI003784D48C
MATSYQCGPLNPQKSYSLMPASSCGPVGVNDQGDPNIRSRVGDTPGPLGVNDYADPLIQMLFGRNFALPNKLSRPLKSSNVVAQQMCLPDGSTERMTEFLWLSQAQEYALCITTVFEGGKSMNYKALAGNFDGQGTSFGLIQWNFGSNTLGPLLKKMKDQNATAFAGCFGTDADYATLSAALDSGSKTDQMKWAANVIKNHKAAWTAAFNAIGSVEDFNKIQREEAAAKYHPAVVSCITKLRAAVPFLLSSIEFRSYAALFDLCVQQGSLSKAWDAVKEKLEKDKPTTQYDVIRIAVTERAKTASKAWVSDCLSRRLGILSGEVYESTENEVTKKRVNGQFELITTYGKHIVATL